MIVSVRALASLAAFAPPDGRLDLPPGATVAAAAGALGLPPNDVGTILCNDAPAEADTPLAPGDKLTFIPPITGG